MTREDRADPDMHSRLLPTGTVRGVLSAYLRIAVVEICDIVPLAFDRVTKLAVGFQSLPLQGILPVFEEGVCVPVSGRALEPGIGRKTLASKTASAMRRNRSFMHPAN